MTIFGMIRCRNESRWIRDSVGAMLHVCERIFVLDDGSEDATDEILEKLSERITLIRSPFRRPIDKGLDEKRDKDLLLQRIMGSVSDIYLRGSETSPFWCLALDADEVIDAAKAIETFKAVLPTTTCHAFSLPIKFLWDSDLSRMHEPGARKIRIDGVYQRFANVGRPSLFRLMNSEFKFKSTPWGGNFHCSSIPQELLHHAHQSIDAPLLHLGYNDQADRVRKMRWYSSVDPRNGPEDEYRHMIQGDGPVTLFDGRTFDIPADARLLHAGPLRTVMI